MKSVFIFLLIIFTSINIYSQQFISVYTDSSLFLPTKAIGNNTFIVKKADLNNAKFIQCKEGTIVKYEIGFSAGGSYYTWELNGNMLTENVISKLKGQKDGTKIYFDLFVHSNTTTSKKYCTIVLKDK